MQKSSDYSSTTTRNIPKGCSSSSMEGHRNTNRSNIMNRTLFWTFSFIKLTAVLTIPGYSGFVAAAPVTNAYIQTNKILTWKITNVKSSIRNYAGLTMQSMQSLGISMHYFFQYLQTKSRDTGAINS